MAPITSLTSISPVRFQGAFVGKIPDNRSQIDSSIMESLEAAGANKYFQEDDLRPVDSKIGTSGISSSGNFFGGTYQSHGPQVVAEMTRITESGVRFVVLTHGPKAEAIDNALKSKLNEAGIQYTFSPEATITRPEGETLGSWTQNPEVLTQLAQKLDTLA